MSAERDHAAIERSVSRLLEDERLTAGLEDASARRLLDWGIRRLETGAAGPDVRRTVRALGQVVQRRAELSPADARRELEEAGLSLSAPAEADLWAERETLTAAEWAGKLLERVAVGAEAGGRARLEEERRGGEGGAEENDQQEKSETQADFFPRWQFWRRRS